VWVLVIQRSLSKGTGFSPEEIAELTLMIIVNFPQVVCSPPHTHLRWRTDLITRSVPSASVAMDLMPRLATSSRREADLEGPGCDAEFDLRTVISRPYPAIRDPNNRLSRTSAVDLFHRPLQGIRLVIVGRRARPRSAINTAMVEAIFTLAYPTLWAAFSGA
jgi:hypothetical protein